MVRKNRVLIILGILLLLTITSSFIVAKADSGWDSSYDVGGSTWDSSSWDSGSSWNGGGGYYYSSSNSLNNPVLTVIISIIIVAMIIGATYVSYKKKINNKIPKTIINNVRYEDLGLEQIQSVINDFNVEEFKREAFNIYKDIQTAWMDFDTQTIRKLTTDELYNMYNAQLTTLKIKKQKNIMKNIEYIDAKVVNVSNDNGVYTVKLYLNVRCLDYVIDTKTNKTIRGKDDRRLNMEYLLTFVKDSTDSKKIENCPNCGAPVDINASATCPYCNSTLVKTATSYALSKKECIGQRME